MHWKIKGSGPTRVSRRLASIGDASPRQINYLRKLDTPEPGLCALELSKSGLSAEKVVFDAPEENRQALVQYLTLVDALTPGKTVNPTADGNWRILPVPGVRLSFLSSSAATKYLSNHPGIRLIRDNGDGSALYELTR